MDDRKWEDSLRKRVADYEVSEPEGLWDAIERSGRLPSRVNIFTRRLLQLSSAAAILAMLFWGAWALWSPKSLDDNGQLAVLDAPAAVLSMPESLAEALPVAIHEIEAVHRSVAAVTGRGTSVLATEAAETENDMAELDVASELPEHNAAEVATSVIDRSSSSSSVPETEFGTVGQQTFESLAAEENARRRHRAGGVTARLLASSFSSGTDMQQHAGYDMSAVNMKAPASAPIAGSVQMFGADSRTDLFFANLSNEVVSESKHHRPLNFGVRVNYEFADRWGIESGLNYAILESDFKSGSNDYYCETEQNLHYLGLPLNVNYNLLRMGNLRLVLSGGGMLEKCVSGDVQTSFITAGKTTSVENASVSVGGLQWSINASASLQYDILKNFGLFVEPGLSYHFASSSTVQSRYTERPLDFSIGAGLRVYFGK